MTTFKKLALAGVASAAVVIGGLGGLAVASAVSTPPPPTPLTEAELSWNPVAKVPDNGAGLTYGFIDQGLLTDASARADLVFVSTDDGKDGYAYMAELLPGYDAKTPEEAAQYVNTEPYQVPVYELDGKTLIGYQTVNRPAER